LAYVIKGFTYLLTYLQYKMVSSISGNDSSTQKV